MPGASREYGNMPDPRETGGSHGNRLYDIWVFRVILAVLGLFPALIVPKRWARDNRDGHLN